VLAENGDGTFTPTYTTFPVEKQSVPQQAADVNGDGRADLIELDGFPASFHVIPSAVGPAFQLALPATPIVGPEGALNITLAVPSSGSTTLQLSASDPNISIPSTATISAGELTLQVPFTIGPAFNPSHVFSLTAQLGSQTASVASYQTSQSLAGFQIIPNFTSETVPPGGTSFNYEPQIISIGGYSTTIQFSCQGLPSGATCQFNLTSEALPAGQMIGNSLTISVNTTTTIGTYPIQLIATDGFITQQLALTLNVADFTVSVTPTSATLLDGQSTNLSLTIGAIGDWQAPVAVSCQVSPSSSLFCNLGGGSVGTSPVAVSVYLAPPGDYTLSITGSDDGVTHAATPVTIHVQGATGSVSPASAQISAGGSSTFSVSLSSANGLTGSFTFSCPGLPSDVSCSFNPTSGALPASGSLTSVLTVSLAAAQSSLNPAKPSVTDIGRDWALFGSLGWFAILLTMAIARDEDDSRGHIRVRRVAAILSLCVMVAVGFAACGSGGGSSSTQNPPSPPSPPPTPPPTVVTIEIQAASASLTQSLGNITIQIPQ
jgi:hypothetical protein